MTIRKLIDSFTGRFIEHEVVNNNQYEQDILGQGVGRLTYPASMMFAAHSDPYDTAENVIKEFEQLVDYEKRLAFWDANPTVFGLSRILVLDSHAKNYWPYYGPSEEHLLDELGGAQDRYRIVDIFPPSIDEFWLFAYWCSRKYIGFDPPPIPSKEDYWKSIITHSFPNDYLTGLLAIAEANQSRMDTLPSPWRSEYLKDELAKQYFYFCGNQNATTGTTGDQTSLMLFSVLNKVLICPLWTYGEITAQYFKSYHITAMVSFLREQKKRLDTGEDIRTPVSSESICSPANVTPTKTLNDSLKIETRYDSPITLIDGAPKKGRGKSKAKPIQDEDIRGLFRDFTTLDGLSTVDAYAKIRDRKGVSDSTINRALKAS